MASVNSSDIARNSSPPNITEQNTSSIKRRIRQASPEPPSLRERLVKVDLFPKAVEESETSSKTSVTLSFLTLLFTITLIIHQFVQWSVVHRDEHIVVDTHPNERLNMFFNITFPKLQCSVCNIDVMDVSGEFSESYKNGVVRQRLSKNGELLGHPVMDSEPLQDMFGEGCRLEVNVDVTKVAGNVHIAVGGQSSATVANNDGVYRTRKHIHKFKVREMKNYDAQHIIHELRFGPSFPGQSQSLKEFHGQIAHVATYQYLFKVVPTTYTSKITKEKVHTNQYNYQKSFNYIDFDHPAAGSIPGLFLIYDFSPYRMDIVEYNSTFQQFFISLCAIVGGSLTIIAILYAFGRACIDIIKKCLYKQEAQGYASVSMQDIIK